AHRQTVRVVRQPVLVLPAARIDPLPKVATAVEEADRDHRQRLVTRLLQEIARKHTEAAGVDRQRDVQAESAEKKTTGPSSPGRTRRGRSTSAATKRASASIRRRISSSRAAFACVAGQRYSRNRTGFCPDATQR